MVQSERDSALHLFDGLGEVDAEVVVGIEAPGDGDQGLSEVGVDGPSVREHRGNEAVGEGRRVRGVSISMICFMVALRALGRMWHDQ